MLMSSTVNSTRKVFFSFFFLLPSFSGGRKGRKSDRKGQNDSEHFIWSEYSQNLYLGGDKHQSGRLGQGWS